MQTGIKLVEQSGTILSREVCFQNATTKTRCPVSSGGKHFLVEFSTEYFLKAAGFWFFGFFPPKLGIKFSVLRVLDKNVYITSWAFEAAMCLFF